MRLTIARLATGAAVALLALTACGAGKDGTAAAKIPATKTGSLEEIAADAHCTPDIQTDADEIRQAVCKNEDGKFILATFATDRGQREWINEAKDYGGFYLVGAKWIAIGDQKLVRTLRGTLGGSLEVGTSHAAHADHEG
ncbi:MULTISPECIES: hypothetical protein [Streptomyces]|uniref:Lipoprotein n=1 Tax=Streptomyces griseoaurantiacus TaxID=68213 RepID=A0ABZ1V982_9ACTN|nr:MULTISPECIES: hypothetical protein [Streptomyces]MCF0091130.1 hypothetical protein [Streptomyces sp. MH192]MCF0103660.1 hypothetical protein [Streptomyces sp. MH191]MDX3359927.1 hypothetical protein [Streptomyces sp. ME02-6978.2a]WTI26472.1 hypothetical protein OHA67_08975 [Streptomyces jietaisiensis]